MTRLLLFTLLFVADFCSLQAQADSTRSDTMHRDRGAYSIADSTHVYSTLRAPGRSSFSPLVVFGVHGGESVFAELGGGFWLASGHGPILTGFGFTGSLLGGYGDEMVGGAELSAWLYSIVVLGASLGYYTDFERGGLVFYPQIGIGLPVAYLGIRFTVAGQPTVRASNTVEMMIRFPFPLE